jgi:hypothetical protein
MTSIRQLSPYTEAWKPKPRVPRPPPVFQWPKSLGGPTVEGTMNPTEPADKVVSTNYERRLASVRSTLQLRKGGRKRKR